MKIVRGDLYPLLPHFLWNHRSFSLVLTMELFPHVQDKEDSWELPDIGTVIFITQSFLNPTDCREAPYSTFFWNTLECGMSLYTSVCCVVTSDSLRVKHKHLSCSFVGLGSTGEALFQSAPQVLLCRLCFTFLWGWLQEMCSFHG